MRLTDIPAAEQPALLLTVAERVVDALIASGARLESERRPEVGLVLERLTGEPGARLLLAAETGSLLRFVLRGTLAEVTHLALLEGDRTDPARAYEAVVEALRAAGATDILWADPTGGDIVPLMADHPGRRELVATQMVRPLDGEVPAEAEPVAIRPMTQPEFEAYRVDSIGTYAAERVQAGVDADLDAAVQAAREQFARMLPDDLATPGHLLCIGEVDGHPVGVLWLQHQGDRAFLTDIVVAEPQRGRGLGTGLLDAAVAEMSVRGAHAIGLNVFGHNDDARRLYEREGYRPVSQTWRAPLG